MALERWSAHEGMAGASLALRSAEQVDELISGFLPTRGGTGVARLAGFVDLARSYAGKTDTWTLSAPDRPIAIPNSCWGACEGRACGDNLGEHQQKHPGRS